jgi:hypothetical protein
MFTLLRSPRCISCINDVVASKREQESQVPNLFLNPLQFWQSYLINWIQASRGFYENAIRANEYWCKAFSDPWLRVAVPEQKGTAKVE